MGLIKDKIEITEEQYDMITAANRIDGFLMMLELAEHAGYHPAGYDCIAPTVTYKDGKYWFEWKHYTSCD